MVSIYYWVLGRQLGEVNTFLAIINTGKLLKQKATQNHTYAVYEFVTLPFTVAQSLPTSFPEQLYEGRAYQSVDIKTRAI